MQSTPEARTYDLVSSVQSGAEQASSCRPVLRSTFWPYPLGARVTHMPTTRESSNERGVKVGGVGQILPGLAPMHQDAMTIRSEAGRRYPTQGVLWSQPKGQREQWGSHATPRHAHNDRNTEVGKRGGGEELYRGKKGEQTTATTGEAFGPEWQPATAPNDAELRGQQQQRNTNRCGPASRLSSSTWSQPWCLPTRRAWRARPAAAAARPSGSRGSSASCSCCTSSAWPPRRRYAQTGRSQTSS